MADNEKALTDEQATMLENMRRSGVRIVSGVVQLEDAVEASLGNIQLNTASFRIAFDGRNTQLAPQIAKKEFFRRPS